MEAAGVAQQQQQQQRKRRQRRRRQHRQRRPQQQHQHTPHINTSHHHITAHQHLAHGIHAHGGGRSNSKEIGSSSDNSGSGDGSDDSGGSHGRGSSSDTPHITQLHNSRRSLARLLRTGQLASLRTCLDPPWRKSLTPQGYKLGLGRRAHAQVQYHVCHWWITPLPPVCHCRPL